jgi:D-alanyl-D-alanine carboxypeptidase
VQSGLLCLLGIILALIVSVLPAEARPPVASIVIDAQSGRVLEAHHADALHYPASLTKLMTLYLTFSALKAHRITLDTQFRVSRHAASQQPTKLGLLPGQRISVRDLILGIVTESANDAAVVLAEGLAGSEPAFAARMTHEARMLGMTRTVFRNASGLPNREQVTTARDLARLARALQLQFPSRYHYFSVHDFRYRGREFRNHDDLIYYYHGMDGMKTGFTDAAGFNLVSSAVRNGRRLIGVVLGSSTPVYRDRLMVGLLNGAFERSAPIAEVAARGTASDGLAGGAHRIMSAFSPVASADAAPTPPQLRRAVPIRDRRRWSIQVGAFAHRSPALQLARKVVRADHRITPRDQRIVAERERNGRPLFRLRYVDLDRWQAYAACQSLHRDHFDCLVRAPAG